MLNVSDHPHTAADPSRILLYAFLPIGDTLFTLPTIHALRDRYPRAEIVTLAHGASTTILRCIDDVDEVLSLASPAGWWRSGVPFATLRRLRDRQFDVAVDFSSPAYKWISLVCDISTRTYMKFDPLWWIVPGRHRRWRTRHAAAHYYACARELGLPPWEEVSHTPEIHIPAGAARKARAILQGRFPGQSGPLILMHPGGIWLNGRKQWPAARFTALAEQLQRRWDARLILVGDAQDRVVADAIGAGLRCPPLVVAGEVPLLTSFALIAAGDLFIGNDSGPLHAAAAVGTPYVGIFGPTAEANFHPLDRYAGQGRLVLPPRPCRSPHYFVGARPVWRQDRCCTQVCAALAEIDASTVFAAADRLLRRRRIGVVS